MRVSVCILGGGTAGLAASCRLGQDKVPHAVLDKRSAPEVPRWWADLTEPVSPADRQTLALLSRLGLAENLSWKSSASGVLLEKCLWDSRRPWGFLLSGPFGLLERRDLFLALRKLSRLSDIPALDNQSAAAFLEKFCEAPLPRQLLLHVLEARTGLPSDHISAAVLADWIRRRVRAHLSWPRRQKKAFLLGDASGLAKTAMTRLEAGGGSWFHAARVTCVERIGQAFRVLWERNGAVQETWADAVINTLPAPIFLRMAKNPPPRYAQDLQSVRFQGSIELSLAIENDVCPFDRLTIAREGFPFAVLRRGYQSKDGAMTRYKLIRPVSKGDAFLSMSDAETLRRFLEGLSEIFPPARKAVVRDWKIAREEFATPVFEPGGLRKIPPQKSPWEGLFNAGPLYAYPDSGSVNNIAAGGAAAAKLALESLRQLDDSPAHFLYREGLRMSARI